MSEIEKLNLYLEKLREIACASIEERDVGAIQALRDALNYIEGELIGY